MFICNNNVKLNKFDYPSFNVLPVLGCNINVNRLCDIFFTGKDQLELQPFITHLDSKWYFCDFLTTESALVFGNSDWNLEQQPITNMDFRTSKIFAICSMFSKLLFRKSVCATKEENSACNACGLIPVLQKKNLTSFALISIDGFASGDRSTIMRVFGVSKLRIELLPYSSNNEFSSFINSPQ